MQRIGRALAMEWVCSSFCSQWGRKRQDGRRAKGRADEVVVLWIQDCLEDSKTPHGCAGTKRTALHLIQHPCEGSNSEHG